MLYTSYISNLDKIPKDAIKLIITRYPPKDLNILKYNNIHIVTELSPSKELLNEYKSSNETLEDWDKYIVKFSNEIITRADMIESIEKIVRGLNKGLDIYLICYEKNYIRCHRFLLAKYIQLKFNIEWKEF